MATQKERTAATDDSVSALTSLKTLARSAAIVLLGLVASKLLTYAYKVVIARSGADFFGTFSIGYAVFDLIALLAGLGIAIGLYRFIPEYAAHKHSLTIQGLIAFSLKAGAVASSIAGIALYLFADAISTQFFHADPQVTLVIQILSFAVPFFVLQNILIAILQGFKRIDRVSLSKNIVENVLKVTAAALAVQWGFGLAGLSYGFVAAQILACCLSIYFVQTEMKIHGSPSSANAQVGRELFRYSLPYLLVLALNAVVTWTDTLFLGHYRTIAETGIYHAALTTSLFMLIAPGIVASLNIQVLVELQVHKRKQDMQKVYQTVSKWIFFLNYPLLLFFTVFSASVLSILYGAEYESGTLSLIILCAGYLVYTVSQPAADALAVFKRPTLAFIDSAVAAVATLALNYVLTPTLGMVGAALASATAFIVYALMGQFQVNRIAGLHPLSTQYIPSLAAGAIAIMVTYALTTFFFPSRVIELVAIACIYGTLYVLLLFLLRGFDETDITLLKSAEKKLGFSFLSPLRNWAKTYYYKK